MSIEKMTQIWPEWTVEKLLGRGSFGEVYKVVRKDPEHHLESYAAIKVISIPQNQSEVDTLRSEGLDLNGSRTYLQRIVNDFIGEIQLMESLKGMQNIVSVEDYKVVEKTNEIGWDILIRMELLTPFNTYISDKKLSESEVIKLGIDISTLNYLQKNSGKNGKDLVEDFLGINFLSYAYIDDDSFLERESLFNALKDVTSSSDTLHAFSSFRGDLRKTDFTATINNISSDFDDIELSKNIKKKTAVNEFHLKNVVSTTHSYDENKKFVKKWVENILGNL